MTISRSSRIWPAGLLAALIAGPLAAQDVGDPATALFRRPRVMAAQNTFRVYHETRPLAVSPSEFFSSGYLSEDAEASFGTLLGPVGPDRGFAQSDRAALQRYTRVAVAAPAGLRYGDGDSLLIVERREGPIGFGALIVPTGMARIVRPADGQATAEIVAVYGPIRPGQRLVPAPHFVNPGRVGLRPVSDGLEGQVLMGREVHELRTPQQVLYLDVGRSEGVSLGDVFEARTTVAGSPGTGARAGDDVLATLKVVHVREHTAAVKVMSVIVPQLGAGTRVRQVGKLAT
jgi:hypothetical protein